MSQQQVDIMSSKLKATLNYDDFGAVDMVVEAVIESIDLKQKIFAGMLDLPEENATIMHPCNFASGCKSAWDCTGQ